MSRGGPQRIPRPASSRPAGPPPWAERVAAGTVAVDLATVGAAIEAHSAVLEPHDAAADARAAAVLVALFEDRGETRVVLTRRSSAMRNHRGEIAFPGGRQDPGEDLVSAALREAHEEVGLDPTGVVIVGELDRLATVASNFVVAPFVGALEARPVLRPNPAEIDRVFDVGLRELLAPEHYREEIWDLGWGERRVSFFELEGETVWGATARILRQFLVLVSGADDPYASPHAHPQL